MKKPAVAFQAMAGEVGAAGSGSNFFVEDLKRSDKYFELFE